MAPVNQRSKVGCGQLGVWLWLWRPSPPLLVSLPGEFMESLQDPDLNVRRATLAFFNSAVHNKPSLVRDLLDDILPFLYQETKIRRDLIREVKPGENTARSPQAGLLGLGRGLGSGSSEQALAHRVHSAPLFPGCGSWPGQPQSSLSLSFSKQAKGKT